MIPFIFVHNQTVEFVYTHRAVILRTIMRSGFICSYSSRDSSGCPFCSTDSFKYDQFAHSKVEVSLA